MSAHWWGFVHHTAAIPQRARNSQLRKKIRKRRAGKCPYILEILGIIPAQIFRGYGMNDTYEEKRGTGMRRYIS